MRTKRTISTVCYNSEEFLRAACDRLVSSGLCDWVHWVRHKPEEDEEKEHVHLVAQPARQVDTRALSAFFEELDPSHPDKPLACMPWRFCSSLDDWLLYAVHDAAYLATKGQARKYHYSHEDVRSTSPDLLAEQWHEVNLAKYGLGQLIQGAVEQGRRWEEVLVSGAVPPAQFRFWEQVFFAMRGEFRRTGKTHTPAKQLQAELKPKEDPAPKPCSKPSRKPSRKPLPSPSEDPDGFLAAFEVSGFPIDPSGVDWPLPSDLDSLPPDVMP